MDAISYLDEACSGRKNCEYLVVGQDLLLTKPCPAGASSYLYVKYECVKGKIVLVILFKDKTVTVYITVIVIDIMIAR